ncbi:MAG: Flp family type IVb pilin [Parvibaculales bacterium]
MIHFKDLANDEKGATALEYALIATLIGVSIIAGITSLRSGIVENMEKSSGAITSSTPAPPNPVNIPGFPVRPPAD